VYEPSKPFRGTPSAVWCDSTASGVSFAATRKGSTGYESESAPGGMTAYNPRRIRTTRPAFWWYARSASCARPPTSPPDDRCLASSSPVKTGCFRKNSSCFIVGILDLFHVTHSNALWVERSNSAGSRNPPCRQGESLHPIVSGRGGQGVERPHGIEPQAIIRPAKRPLRLSGLPHAGICAGRCQANDIPSPVRKYISVGQWLVSASA
jgi:hypothetical protein